MGHPPMFGRTDAPAGPPKGGGGEFETDHIY
jgi:hypothetical protein